MNDIKSILENIGYNLKDDGNYWRSLSLYRNGDNPTSLRINKKTGHFVDFPINKSGSFNDLLKLSLGFSSTKDIDEYLKDKDFQPSDDLRIKKLKVEKTFNLDELGTIVRNFNFYKKRGIEEGIQQEFDLSVCMSGKMRGRVVFPIYDKNKSVLGFSGRTVFKDNEIKWKHLGAKSSWCYPLYLSESRILELGEVILVESIGDCLALFNAGFRHVICLFGIKLLSKVKQELIRLSPKKIIISTNNEPDNENRGNNAAKEIFNDLSKLFSVNRLYIKLPPKKDFGECSKEEIINWYGNNK